MINSIRLSDGIKINVNNQSFPIKIIEFPFHLFSDWTSGIFRLIKTDQIYQDVFQLAQNVKQKKKLNSKEKQFLAQIINSPKFTKIKKPLIDIFLHGDSEDIKSIFYESFNWCLEQDNINLNLDHYFDMPLNQLNEELKEFIKQMNDVQNFMKCSLDEEPKKTHGTFIHEMLPNTWRFVTRIIDIFIKMTRLESLRIENGEITQMEIYNSFVYSQLLSYPTAIFLMMAGICSTPLIAAGATASIIILTLISVNFYIDYLRPCPLELPPMTNLVLKAKKGQLNLIESPDDLKGVEHDIKKLVKHLENERSVILSGKSGVGKSTLVEALALKIALRKQPEFYKKQIFRINCSQLLERSTNTIYTNSLPDLLKKLKKNKNNVILFFDEVQELLKDVNKGVRGQLMDFMDEFPYIIFATNRYEDIATNSDWDAILRRHERLEVFPISDEATANILARKSRKIAPEIPINRELLEHIIYQTKEYFPTRGQPDISLRILKEALAKVYKFSDEQSENRQKELKENIESVQLSYSLNENFRITKDIIRKVGKFRNDLKSEKAKYTKKKNLHDLYIKLLKTRALLKNHSSLDYHKGFVIEKFLTPALECRIENIARNIFQNSPPPSAIASKLTPLSDGFIDQIIHCYNESRKGNMENELNRRKEKDKCSKII